MTKMKDLHTEWMKDAEYRTEYDALEEEFALAQSRSLVWQEKWIAGVQAGIESADRGQFATDDEIAAVLNKYS